MANNLKFNTVRKPLILMALILVLGGYLYFFQGDKSKQEVEQKNIVPVFTDFKAEDYTKLLVTKKDETITLLKRDGVWYVVAEDGQEHMATTDVIEQVLTKMGNIKTGEVISTNPDKLSTFNLDEAGIKVGVATAHDADPVVNFVIGKNGPYWPSQYIRLADNSDVLLIKEYLLGAFDKQTVNDWREKRIMPKDWWQASDKVTKVDYIARKPYYKAFTINKNDEGWVVDQFKKPAKDDVVKRMVDMMINLRATDFITYENETDLTKHNLGNGKETLKITLTQAEDTITLLVGEANENGNYYAMLEGGTEMYLISSGIDVFADQDYNSLVKK